jgi:integrase
MIQEVYKPRRRVGGVLKISRVYRGRYRFGDMTKCAYVALGVADKQVAERMLAQIVTEKQRESVGLIDPKAVRDGASRRLGEHVVDYSADLAKKGRDAKYIENVQRWIRKLASEGSWRRVSDITPDSFIAWRSRQSKAPRTLNHYLEATRAFLNWLEGVGRINSNPLSRVQKVEERGQEKRVRRSLTDDEMKRLLTSSGERKLFYLTAVHTGLRRDESKKLEWGDVFLGDKPSLRVRGSTTKNKKSCTIPMHPELAAEFRKIEVPANLALRVFVGAKYPTRYTRQRDFKNAGIPHIDQHGRIADLHALRHTLNTRLQSAGVGMRTAMEVMRHSDPRLTSRTYTDAMALPTTEAIGMLPSFLHDAQIDAHISGAAGHSLASADIKAPIVMHSQVPIDETEKHAPASSGTEWQETGNGSSGRIRTYDQSVNSRPLYH